MDLVVEVADVTHDRLVLHLLHVLEGDDVAVGDLDVREAGRALDRIHFETFHRRLERVEKSHKRVHWLLAKPLRTPTFEIHKLRIEVQRSVTEFRAANQVRVVRFCATAAGCRVHFAAKVSPIRLRMGVTIQNRTHDMDELDVTALAVDSITSDHVPS